ncbi:MAG: hypothetical protein GU354_04775 [Caldimicrobium sp.]|nr:hypothetical protein [Caldimicrobium sp.]
MVSTHFVEKSNILTFPGIYLTAILALAFVLSILIYLRQIQGSLKLS